MEEESAHLAWLIAQDVPRAQTHKAQA